MKFKPDFKNLPHSELLGMMTDRDRNIFRRAFSSKPSPGDREWVNDVFELTAEKLGLQKCQVIQAFKLGTTEILVRFMHENANKNEQESESESNDEVIKPSLNAVRSAWSWALTLRHPKVKISDSDKAVSSAVAKVAASIGKKLPSNVTVERKTTKPKVSMAVLA